MVTCYLGIGSNLGNRRRYILLATKKIRSLRGCRLIASSRIIETSPVGGPRHQGKFLNAAVKIETTLAATDLLDRLKRIERELGRVKTARNGPRTIDLDILFYGNVSVRTKDLDIPHPRIFEREFVLKPLLELL